MPRALSLCLLLVPASLGAQTPGEPRGSQPSWFASAMAEAAAGDTAAAIERLRANLRSEPDYGPGWLALGRLLAEHAGEAASAFPLDPGEYAIHIVVTDASSGERAESVRRIRIERASDPPRPRPE